MGLSRGLLALEPAGFKNSPHKSSCNQTCPVAIMCRVARQMQISYQKHFERQRFCTHATVAVALLAFFLTARTAPLHLSTLLSIHSSVATAASSLNHRPKFDSDSLQWAAPTDSGFPLLLAQAQPLTLRPRPISQSESKGLRYNRPPPIS
jgi:hypothetical protein